ncbi:uncharacterized protein ARMOST_15173 [Armillaria ostoyae]|uniref:Uncharacterized protein n=1 Tax=Armillaria ostoyae TaxID=47428 RepID=A0A284RSM6_ARMOS|nr:uncharacterized protein ARMOST_15173 [Armillaria ostoyae]
MAKTSGTDKSVMGPPQALIEHIEHLRSLFRGILESSNLPLNPSSSKYYFALDPNTLEDGGGFAALSQCLEIVFETWQGEPDAEIQLTEHGERLDNLAVFLKDTLQWHIKTELDQHAFKEAWIERLITAAR